MRKRGRSDSPFRNRAVLCEKIICGDLNIKVYISSCTLFGNIYVPCLTLSSSPSLTYLRSSCFEKPREITSAVVIRFPLSIIKFMITGFMLAIVTSFKRIMVDFCLILYLNFKQKPTKNSRNSVRLSLSYDTTSTSIPNLNNSLK